MTSRYSFTTKYSVSGAECWLMLVETSVSTRPLSLGEVNFGNSRLTSPLPTYPRPLDKFKKGYYDRRNMEPLTADSRQPDEPE